MEKRFCKSCGEELTKTFCKNCGAAPDLKKAELVVENMVCHSCDSITARTAKKIEGVVKFKGDYTKGRAEVVFDPEKTSLGKVIRALKEKGYPCRLMTPEYKKKQMLKNALVMGVLGIVIAAVVMFSGSIGADPNLLEGASLAVVFIFGLLTGFHCLGMCGGFVLSYATKLEGRKYNPMPHLSYNIGRVITYSFLGLLVGFLGSLVAISYSTQGVLIIIASMFMVLLGLNLIGVFTVFRGVKLGRLKNPLGGLVAKGTRGNRGPFVLGLLNGFVPCGMVYIVLFAYVPLLGSAISGAIAMAVFGLGTIPLMFLYGSAIAKLTKILSKNFVKYSGVFVILLAVVMLNRGVVLAGIPEAPDMDQTLQDSLANLPDSEYQDIEMRIVHNDFIPNKFTVEAGKPVRWTIIGESVTGCSNEIIMPEFGIDVPVETGETKVAYFLPEEKGTYQFSCWMAMLFGEIEVI